MKRVQNLMAKKVRVPPGIRTVILLVGSLAAMLVFVAWLAISFNERITRASASESDQTIWNISQLETDFLRMLLAAEAYNSTYANGADEKHKQQQYNKFVTRFDIFYSRMSVYSTTVGQRVPDKSYNEEVTDLFNKTIAWAEVVDSTSINDEAEWKSFIQDLRGHMLLVRGLITNGLEIVVDKEETQRLEELSEWKTYSRILTVTLLMISGTILGAIYFAVKLYLRASNAETTVSVLTDTSRELELLSITDPLTGLLTRRALDQVFKSDAPTKATVLWLDIDEFKSVNDTWGHKAGDELLQAVAKSLSEFVEDRARVFRLGGEEFGIIAPWYENDAAEEWALGVCNRVAQSYITIDGYNISRTASVGVAYMNEDMTPEEALELADRAMYEAKSSGKNRVKFAKLS